MTTEPKPESPAELAADEAIRRMYALRDEVWKSARGSNDVDVGEAMAACRNAIEKLAALATIQASASASQEPVAQVIFTSRKKPDVEWLTDTVQAGTLLYTAATQARPASGEAVSKEILFPDLPPAPPSLWPEGCSLGDEPCKACGGTGTIRTHDSVGLVDQWPCDLCNPDEEWEQDVALGIHGGPANIVEQVRHTPEEWGPSHDRRLTCSCGNPDPGHMDAAPTSTPSAAKKD